MDLVADLHELLHLVLHALDLVNVDLAVLLLERLVGALHGVDGRHDVLQVVRHHRRLFHVPRLLLQLVPLRLVQLAPLQDLERFLPQRRFARSVAHFRHARLVGGEFGVEFGEFHVERVDMGFCLMGKNCVSGGGVQMIRGGTLEDEKKSWRKQ